MNRTENQMISMGIIKLLVSVRDRYLNSGANIDLTIYFNFSVQRFGVAINPMQAQSHAIYSRCITTPEKTAVQMFLF